MMPPNKDEPLIISKEKWTKICLAASIMTISLYLIAMIFSLCGSSYFILNYQNTQMDSIELWLRQRNIIAPISDLFITLETAIILTFVAKNNGVEFDHFNEYDWCYVMNMLYSDYYGSVPNETSVYLKMAKKFLDNKDAKDGKAYRYWLAMK